MDGRKVRAVGAALLSAGLAAVTAAPALADGFTVGSLSSLRAGATHGILHGQVLDRSARATRARVVVRVMRYGTRPRVVGRTAVRVRAGGAARYRVAVRLPSHLSRGNYYLSACTPDGAGSLGCATAERDLRVGGGTPVRGARVRLPAGRAAAHAARAEVCSSGAHTLVKPGDRVFPELGNGGYASVHTD